MRRTKKNGRNSSSASLSKKKGRKSKSSLNKSSSKKRSLIKKVRNSTRKSPARTPLRVTKHRRLAFKRQGAGQEFAEVPLGNKLLQEQ